ncbi:type II secretion system F family protein [Bacillus aquiflavi]|uniref:competence type IV pilus assembly protein ComGB n=1 Tax=Bacillus aquiflavi TaxID=2672567 RepID=UPI001CA85F51|nr:competence type IV pilus assembly protein ComGB [Bacillus aquiflavi]UAC47233.1 type II secretion system F family protein [Bacillus aquiflavi]
MRRYKWSIREQANFLKYTGELIERGYPLSEAIESLTFQLKEKRKKEIGDCLEFLKEGRSFSYILTKLGFKEDLIGYVFFSEQHGGLANALQDGSEVMLKRRKDIERLLKLLYYPLILIFITILLFIAVENMLLPRFTSLFNTLQLEANFFMIFVKSFAEVLPIIVPVSFIIILLFLSYYVLFFRKLPSLQQKQLLVRLPFSGSFCKLLYTHYFAIQLSYLLSGGIPIYDALIIFEKNKKQRFYHEIGMRIRQQLVKGEKLEKIFSAYSFFEEELSKIVAHGQKNGKLDKELFFYSHYCLRKLEEKTEKGLKVVQPVLYSTIGLLIISMYLAILLPMFQLLDGF